jgi:hypothetical protein
MAKIKTVRKTSGAAAKSKPASAKSVSSKSVSTKSALLPISKARAVKTAPAKSGPVKIGSAKSRIAAPPAPKPKFVASQPAWPQAMSTGGAVTAHAIGATTKPAGTNGAVHGGSQVRSLEAKPARQSHGAPSQAAAPWLTPWTHMNLAATQLMAPDAMKAAIDRQFQLYQAMARYSPLTLALQLMQGLLPDGARAASAPVSNRR